MQRVNELGVHFVLLPFGLLGGEGNHTLQSVRLGEATYHVLVVSWAWTLPILEHSLPVEAGSVQFDRLVTVSAAAAHCVPHLGDACLEWLVASRTRLLQM